MPKGFKAGGRTKGTPNKKTANLKELIEENYSGFDPIIELIAISKQEKLPVDLKVSIYKSIAEYIYPKRKAIEAEITAETAVKQERTFEDIISELIDRKRKNLPFDDL